MIHGRLAMDYLLVPITRQWSRPSRRVNSTTFITCLSIQNDSVSHYQKILESIVVLYYNPDCLPFYYRYPPTALILNGANHIPTPYYLLSHKSLTNCGTNCKRLLALGRDLDHHILARARYPSIRLETHEGPCPPFKFTPWSGSSGPSLYLSRLRPDLQQFFSTSLQRQTRLKRVTPCTLGSDVNKRPDLHLNRWCQACGLKRTLGPLTEKGLRAACEHWPTVIGRQCWRSQRDNLKGEGGLGRGFIMQENYIQIAESGGQKRRHMLRMYQGPTRLRRSKPTPSLIIDPHHLFAATPSITW